MYNGEKTVKDSFLEHPWHTLCFINVEMLQIRSPWFLGKRATVPVNGAE